MRNFLIFQPLSCLRNVFVPTSEATDLNFFFPVETFPNSDAAISSKSQPIFSAAETTYLLKNGIAVFQLFVLTLQILFPTVLNNHKYTVNHYQQPFFTTLNQKLIVVSFTKHCSCYCFFNRG